MTFRKAFGPALALALSLLPSSGTAQAPAYNISTAVGNGKAGYSGDGGPAPNASISGPCKLTTDAAGDIFFADADNSFIREVNGSGTITSVAGDGLEGYSGDGGPATKAELAQPCGVIVDGAGNLYFAQQGDADSAIREVVKGTINTIAGSSTTGSGFSGDGGPASSALLDGPIGMAFDAAGNLYFADSSNNRIRVIGTDGNINTVVGNGNAAFGGDNGPALQAALHSPQAVAFDSAGNLYIADTQNHRIRKVTNNVITTIAGTGSAGFSGDGGPAAKAQLNTPRDVAVDSSGNVFIVDSFNFRIRMITPDGTIYTIAGSGAYGGSGDGGPATGAAFEYPLGIAVGPNGVLYVSDTGNNRIRMLKPVPGIGHAQGVSSCGASPSVSPGAWTEIYGFNLAVSPYLWTTSDFVGNNAPTSLNGTQVSIGGQNAVIAYVSPGQVNAQVPLSTGIGPQLITITDTNGTSAAYTITVNSTQPGLCQGASVNGVQYVAAAFSDGLTYVLPSGANIGAPARPAHPGEIITLYGNGFGPVSPSPPQGQVVQQQNALTSQFQISFGQTAASVIYAGLAPGAIGLYQFNVVVPNVSTNNSVPISFALGGVPGSQKLFTAVQAP